MRRGVMNHIRHLRHARYDVLVGGDRRLPAARPVPTNIKMGGTEEGHFQFVAGFGDDHDLGKHKTQPEYCLKPNFIPRPNDETDNFFPI